jgi:hypothetical protein
MQGKATEPTRVERWSKTLRLYVRPESGYFVGVPRDGLIPGPGDSDAESTDGLNQRTNGMVNQLPALPAPTSRVMRGGTQELRSESEYMYGKEEMHENGTDGVRRGSTSLE